MDTTVSFLGHLAMLGLVGAGLLWIVGCTAARDWALRFAARAVALAIALPLAFAFACVETEALKSSVSQRLSAWEPPDASTAFLVAFLLGHAVLGVILLRRRLLGAEAARRRAAALEQARSRERERLPPEVGQEEP